MRTTVALDDDVLTAAKAIAHQTNKAHPGFRGGEAALKL
jgi:hypothetical protein